MPSARWLSPRTFPTKPVAPLCVPPKLTEARAAKPADTGKQKLSVVRAADNAGKALRASKY